MIIIRKRWWKILDYVYDRIRFVFWRSYDINEDFECGFCQKPVFRRLLYCSVKCFDLHLDKGKKP